MLEQSIKWYLQIKNGSISERCALAKCRFFISPTEANGLHTEISGWKLMASEVSLGLCLHLGVFYQYTNTSKALLVWTQLYAVRTKFLSLLGKPSWQMKQAVQVKGEFCWSNCGYARSIALYNRAHSVLGLFQEKSIRFVYMHSRAVIGYWTHYHLSLWSFFHSLVFLYSHISQQKWTIVSSTFLVQAFQPNILQFMDMFV